MTTDRGKGRHRPIVWGFVAFLLVAALVVFVRLKSESSTIFVQSPYTPALHSYKGQLHCHTLNSDGHQLPGDLVRAYRQRGYSFIAVTDHNYITAPPRVEGMVVLPGVEDSTPYGHVNRIGAVGKSGTESAQKNILQAQAEGSFVFICHPGMYEPGTTRRKCSFDDVLALQGSDGIEIWNALVQADGRMERDVDRLLTMGRRYFLLADDDCHDIGAPSFAATATVVFADSLTARDVLMALHTGNFYATCGPVITSVEVKDRVLTVTSDEPGSFEFIIRGGEVRTEARNARSASCRLRGDEVYVRARVRRQSDGKLAWTNPVYVTSGR